MVAVPLVISWDCCGPPTFPMFCCTPTYPGRIVFGF